jgi:MFS family permease
MSGVRNSLEPMTQSALIGVIGMFMSHGVMVAVRAAYIPVIKAQLGATDAELALCLTAQGLGFLLAVLLSNPLVKQLGSAKVTLYSVIAAALFFAIQAYIQDLWLMAAALFLVGAAAGVSDIAMSVQASVVEQRAGGSYMTRIHGCWSVGAIAGSLFSGFVIEHMSAAAFTIGFSVLSVIAAWASIVAFIPEDRSRAGHSSRFELPPPALWMLCLMQFLVLLAFSGIRDWFPIYLLEDLGSTLSLSVQTFAAFQATTAIGRFLGDSIRTRFGERLLLVGGGLLGGLAVLAGLASQSVNGMFIALMVFGLAHANIIPALISIAGKQDPGQESRNVSSVIGIGYSGFILGPFLIGALADWKGMTAALVSVGAASLLIAVFAYTIGRRSTAD